MSQSHSVNFMLYDSQTIAHLNKFYTYFLASSYSLDVQLNGSDSCAFEWKIYLLFFFLILSSSCGNSKRSKQQIVNSK